MSSANKTEPFLGGSTLNTSVAAPAILPCLNASASAGSFTMPPRAQLIKNAVSFIALNASVEIKSRVSSVNGQCSVKKST